MFITHSYIGTSCGEYRYAFYLLFEDYIEAQSSFMQDFDKEIERFARNLKNDGAVIRPFLGDIEATRQQILDKTWRNGEERCFYHTPGLLVLSVPFSEFDPDKHSWAYFCFDVKDFDGNRHALMELSKKINENVDIFKAVENVSRQYRRSKIGKVFEAKPGIWGFSIDLVNGWKYLKECL